VEVDPDAAKTRRTFIVHSTGHLYPAVDKEKFIGTVLVLSGMMVWHVFEKEA
jgi:hypothetical protein